MLSSRPDYSGMLSIVRMNSDPAPRWTLPFSLVSIALHCGPPSGISLRCGCRQRCQGVRCLGPHQVSYCRPGRGPWMQRRRRWPSLRPRLASAWRYGLPGTVIAAGNADDPERKLLLRVTGAVTMVKDDGELGCALGSGSCQHVPVEGSPRGKSAARCYPVAKNFDTDRLAHLEVSRVQPAYDASLDGGVDGMIGVLVRILSAARVGPFTTGGDGAAVWDERIVVRAGPEAGESNLTSPSR